MKKLLFIFCAILFSTTAFSDDLIFRMFNTTGTNTSNTSAGSSLSLSDYYYFYIGGSAYVYNGGTSAAKLVDGGVARIMHKDSYIQINLPSGHTVQAGDIIKYDGNYESSKNIYLHKKGGDSAGGRSGAVKVNGTQAYTVKSTDVIVGASTIYINLGQNMSLNYISYFTITRPSALVKFYAFNEMMAVNTVSTATNQYELVPGELYLNSDGRTGETANSIKSFSGKPNAIYMNGPGENQATLLHVTDPCQIKIWGWSNRQKLGICVGAYDTAAIDTTIVINSYGKSSNMNLSGSYNYNGFKDSMTIYIGPTSTSGAFYIAAIRVEYPRIRPVANFSVTPTEATLHVGESQVFTYNKDYDEAVITRSKTDESDESWVVSGTEVENTSVEMTALEAGAGHTYTLKLTQVADAYCREAVVEVPITIVSTPTGVENIQQSVIGQKVLQDGQLYILRDGKTYNLLGTEIK